MDGLEILEQSGELATAALIFLHGVGETGKEAKEYISKFLEKPGHEYIKIYFPTSKRDYLKIRDKVTTYWINCARTGVSIEDIDVDIDDCNEGTNMIERIVADIEASGIPRERIALGGTSQGGMLSIFAGYVRGLEVGAIVGISASFTFFLRKVKLIQDSPIPMLSLYGLKDAFIPPDDMNACWQHFKTSRMKFLPISLPSNGHFMDLAYTRKMFEWLEKKFPDLSD